LSDVVERTPRRASAIVHVEADVRAHRGREGVLCSERRCSGPDARVRFGAARAAASPDRRHPVRAHETGRGPAGAREAKHMDRLQGLDRRPRWLARYQRPLVSQTSRSGFVRASMAARDHSAKGIGPKRRERYDGTRSLFTPESFNASERVSPAGERRGGKTRAARRRRAGPGERLNKHRA